MTDTPKEFGHTESETEAMRGSARGIAQALIEYVETSDVNEIPEPDEPQPEATPQAEPTDAEAACHDETPTENEAAPQDDKNAEPGAASMGSEDDTRPASQLRMDL